MIVTREPSASNITELSSGAALVPCTCAEPPVLNVACQHVLSLQASVPAGMACALVSGALFLLVATCCGMPVSTTHAIAGAVLGMTAAGAGFACIRWGYPGQSG